MRLPVDRTPRPFPASACKPRCRTSTHTTRYAGAVAARTCASMGTRHIRIAPRAPVCTHQKRLAACAPLSLYSCVVRLGTQAHAPASRMNAVPYQPPGLSLNRNAYTLKGFPPEGFGFPLRLYALFTVSDLCALACVFCVRFGFQCQGLGFIYPMASNHKPRGACGACVECFQAHY